jgi:hypothetical protein
MTSSNSHHPNSNNTLGIYSSAGLTGTSPRDSKSQPARPSSMGRREGNQILAHQRYGKPLVPSNASSVSLQVHGPSYA